MATNFYVAIRASGSTSPAPTYTSWSGFDTNVPCDLTAAATKVASHGGVTGTLADGDSVEVQGATSNTATIQCITDDASGTGGRQVLLTSIVGTISNGDTLQKVGATSNNLTLSSAPDSAIVVAELYDDWTGNGLNSQLSFTAADGWTTDATNKIIIQAKSGQGHGGIPGGGARFYTTSANPLYIDEDNIEVYDIEVRSSNVGGYAPVRLVDFAAGIVLDRCIFKTLNQGASVDFRRTTDVLFRNSLCIGEDHNNTSCIATTAYYSSPDNTIQNITCIYQGSSTRVDNMVGGSKDIGEVSNVVTFDYTGSSSTDEWNFSGTVTTIRNNASGDTTAQGTSPTTGITSADFFAPASDDWAPAASGSDLAGNGVDLSGSFTDDIENDTRSGTWSIGAWHIAAAGGSTTSYYNNFLHAQIGAG